MKMNQTWKRQDIDIRPGMRIKGKWHDKHYIVKRKLGEGAVGTVYLCESNGRPVALKISDQGASMTVEVNVLQSLKKVQGNLLGPSLLDVDDWVSASGAKYAFYVMEYLQGESITSFIKRHGDEWIGVLMLQLLDGLEQLHHSGWIFGDLKIDNLLVITNPPSIRWVDVGGTTRKGRAIKEYTEFYDRGYWGMGTRRAEPSYDLFSFVMVFLHVYYPRRFDKGTDPEKTLVQKINAVRVLTPYREPLKRAIRGKYQSSVEMKQDITDILRKQQRQIRTRTSRKAKKASHAPFLIESGGIVMMATLYYLFSLLL
ncbi:serine/threonine-protein kinase [Virgibacillus halotolerans]|uniref:protein kinase domain-containing protein n=1 Tax=Virgibacillus halotolerans TaxID=1071053 RepID=UPI0019617961|nr:protein kinase [Virgibacillus halotolerans]MBM7601283.1 serine/threonine-protein kinase [Virgibacillus halotolerans]